MVESAVSVKISVSVCVCVCTEKEKRMNKSYTDKSLHNVLENLAGQTEQLNCSQMEEEKNICVHVYCVGIDICPLLMCCIYD